jgi:hypothetical protein
VIWNGGSAIHFANKDASPQQDGGVQLDEAAVAIGHDQEAPCRPAAKSRTPKPSGKSRTAARSSRRPIDANPAEPVVTKRKGPETPGRKRGFPG